VTVRDPATLECREVVEIVSDFLDGSLPARDRARVEQHLLVCPPCSRYLAQMRATVGGLGDLRAAHEPVEVGRELVDLFRQWKRKGSNDDPA
jgi:anti-sigma factor RsiW